MRLDYPAVCARLNRWGYFGHLVIARRTRITAAAARLYAAAIVPGSIVRVKRVRTSWAYRHNNSITIACDNQRTVSLASVLHELAHLLDYRKGKLANGSHGESFCRTYARLLREVM